MDFAFQFLAQQPLAQHLYLPIGEIISQFCPNVNHQVNTFLGHQPCQHNNLLVLRPFWYICQNFEIMEIRDNDTILAPPSISVAMRQYHETLITAVNPLSGMPMNKACQWREKLAVKNFKALPALVHFYNLGNVLMHERQNPRNQRAVGVDNDVGLHLGDDFFCTLYCRQHAFAAREHPTRSGLYVPADCVHPTVQRVRGTDIR